MKEYQVAHFRLGFRQSNEGGYRQSLSKCLNQYCKAALISWQTLQNHR